MAVVDTKSTQITNLEASPVVKTAVYDTFAKVRRKAATVEAANGDSIGSTFRFFRVRSSDVVSALKLYCDAITSGAADVGLYDTLENGAAVVDADFFASAQSIASAIKTGTEIQHESDVFNIDDVNKRVWEALGLTADPGKEYDVVATLTAAAAAAGTITLVMEIVEN